MGDLVDMRAVIGLADESFKDLVIVLESAWTAYLLIEEWNPKDRSTKWPKYRECRDDLDGVSAMVICLSKLYGHSLLYRSPPPMFPVVYISFEKRIRKRREENKVHPEPRI